MPKQEGEQYKRRVPKAKLTVSPPAPSNRGYPHRPHSTQGTPHIPRSPFIAQALAVLHPAFLLSQARATLVNVTLGAANAS